MFQAALATLNGSQSRPCPGIAGMPEYLPEQTYLVFLGDFEASFIQPTAGEIVRPFLARCKAQLMSTNHFLDWRRIRASDCVC